MTQSIPALQLEKKALTKHRRALHALTGLRFFLAFYVVLHHTRLGHFLYDDGHTFAGNFFFNGHVAVAEFFLLSGFILSYTYRSQIETPRDRVRFWQARFARIWPGYVFSLLASTFILHSTPSSGLVVATLFMVQGWNPAHIDWAGAWNAVCWTLSVEALFYLIFPWLQKALEKLRLRQLELFAIGSLLCIILCNTANKGIGYTGYSGIFQYIPYPVLHLPEFFLGVAAGNFFLEYNAEKPLRDRGLLTYAGLLGTVVILGFPSARWTSTVMASFLLLTYGLAAERTLLSRFLSTRMLLLGGGASYSIYLLQTPVRGLIDPHFEGGNTTHYIIGKLLLFATLFLVSLLTFLFLEEPARKFLRRKFAEFDERHLNRVSAKS
jgi:peptidoglycan/LPS O-acetylase OafA/YrhL